MTNAEGAAEALCWLRLRGIALQVVGGHLFASRAPDAMEALQISLYRDDLITLVPMVGEVVDLQSSHHEYAERLRFAPFWCACGVMFSASDKTTTHRCPVCGKKAKREMTYPRRKRDRGTAAATGDG